MPDRAPDSDDLPGERPLWQRLIPLAMVVVVLVAMVGATFVGWAYWRQQPVETRTVTSPRGELADLALPGGSSARLDSSTRTEVSVYRDHRLVKLTVGQAVFQLADGGQPIEVSVGRLRLSGADARFAVRHTPRTDKDHRVRVAVEAGQVLVTGPQGEVALHAGEQVESDTSGQLGPISRFSAEDFAPWREFRVRFDKTPLVDVLAEFERYGPTGLGLSERRLADLPVTGTFDPRRVDELRRVLQERLPVRFETRGDVTGIVPAP